MLLASSSVGPKVTHVSAVTACAIASEHDGRGYILSACSAASWSLWHSRQQRRFPRTNHNNHLALIS